MDILDSLKSVLGSKEGKQDDLMSSVMSLIGGQGGLNGLINQFNSKGLGDIISSWVGTGKNNPISPNQLENVLDNDTINSITSKLGIGKSDLMGQLSNLLPQVVDKLTPDGKIPEGDISGKSMDLLGGLFGKK